MPITNDQRSLLLGGHKLRDFVSTESDGELIRRFDKFSVVSHRK